MNDREERCKGIGDMEEGLLQKARAVALEAHAGQVDKAGVPYIHHCEFVSDHAKTFEGKVAGYLHDVMEDTDYPPEKLRAEFGEAIFEALVLLSHREGVPYMDYIRGLLGNPIAVDVKQADLRHNMDVSRLEHPTERDYQRLKKYQEAYGILQTSENSLA